MRRAIIQNLRTFRRPNPRKALKQQLRINNSSYNASFQRSIANRTPQQQIQSSMRFSRRVSTPIALVGVGAAAYYVYQQRSSDGGAAAASPTLPGQSLVSSQGRTYSTTTTASPQAQATASNQPVDIPGPGEVPEAVRKALIVDQGQLYTAQIPADQVISKETSDYSGKKVLEMLTPDQATAKLRRNEESYLVGRGEGVVRYDVVQIPSNDPIEDDHVEKIVEVPNTIAASEDGKARSDWMFWGVFDGHAGWTTSAKLRQTLVSYVARELNATYKSALADPALNFPHPDAVDAAIKKGFLKLDNEITHNSAQKVLKAQSKVVAAEILAPALSGSCALLSFYDSRSKLLRVACTGDSRAVLGRRSTVGNGKWTATALSIDQTGGTESEAARLRAEHPGEPGVTQNGRILGGLEPSRAFGDAMYKWSMEVQQKLHRNYFARTPNRNVKTPPYVTAEPVVTTTRVDPTKGDFVVMATDGLWEMLTNEEVVGLVGQWLDRQGSSLLSSSSQSGRATSASVSAGGWLQSWFSTQKASALPIEHHDSKESSGQRAPIRQQQWGVPTGQDTRFVVEDKNAATHLVRNALGGKDSDMLSALLTLPAPFSRRYRDDLTVQVIFFGEGGGVDGKVELNSEASATAANGGKGSGEVKAKL
ncbi:[Pyruvate dehydrogenase [acetyl-transferring]]-phosphatase 1, mitochondrial [Recurvomyces mirabilis]|uniref:[Pyruvate dehydrogenase [acetyl-transferring]]-phosphatase 1, mitochondrial n=1 Tax=Recurvomyces mirabilis TaxID=574656 RepID=A0AAE0WGH3_9PEZI|nr:[Pyruvate dehydrogenase [acetyl-transferring]]-phosphatase 1, mitochondrial [Recurvomyces mirabilis]KAK5156612.1 [Pyruvate dehydrogenase [acetyl-transferring]]-phosphatase 1, mitochondrial [Recurvomyces mirabilis]